MKTCGRRGVLVIPNAVDHTRVKESAVEEWRAEHHMVDRPRHHHEHAETIRTLRLFDSRDERTLDRAKCDEHLNNIGQESEPEGLQTVADIIVVLRTFVVLGSRAAMAHLYFLDRILYSRIIPTFTHFSISTSVSAVRGWEI